MAKKRIPVGLTELEWDTIVDGLKLRPTTINDYRKVINLLHKYEDGKYRIQTINKEQANEYFNYLEKREKEGTLSSSTSHRYQATLRSVGAFMESSRSLWPGYKNPFSKLVRNETRPRTTYAKDTFPNPKDVEQLIHSLDKIDKKEQIAINFMFNLGLCPNQIMAIKVSAFDRRVRSTDIPLTLKVDTGTFQETNADHFRNSPYRKAGFPVRYVRRTKTNTITWRYQGTFAFNKPYEEELIDYYKNIGITKDTRKFFLTKRHLEFNYRAIHHMMLCANEAAGLDRRAITPHQLSLYGIVRSYLIQTTTTKISLLQASIDAEYNEARLAELTYAKDKLERLYEQLAKLPIIGTWQDRFPIPLERQINTIKRQMGPEFLLEVVGIDPESLK